MKLLKKIGITILCLLLICGIGIVCLFHNEYSSLKSLKKIEDSLMKAVVSVLGEDQVGIIAKVSALLAQKQINILDVSQTIMDGNFVMMMSVMIPENLDSYQLTNEFTELGKEIGVEINLRNAKIYDVMHNL